MTKYDPKLLKKIPHSKLIAAAKEIGIKNADKVRKEQLTASYLESVEAKDPETYTATVIEMYNEIVVTLELDKGEPDVETPEEVTPEVPTEGGGVDPTVEVAAPAPEVLAPTVVAPVTKPAPKPPLAKLAPRVAAKPAPVPAPGAPAPATKVTPKAEKPKPKPPERYTRINAMAEAMAEMKQGGELEALYNKASQKYIAHGGTDKIIEATFFCNIGLSAAKALGFIEITATHFKPIK